MRKVKRGNTRKVLLIFDLYSLQLYNYYFQLTLNQKISEVLVLKVFQQMIQYRNTFNKKIRFKSWMFRIARNVYYQYKAENVYDIEEELFKDDINNQNNDVPFSKAMSTVTESMKELILLAKFFNYDYRLLGDVFNTSESDVKNRIHRVVDEFRKVYVNSIN